MRLRYSIFRPNISLILARSLRYNYTSPEATDLFGGDSGSKSPVIHNEKISGLLPHFRINSNKEKMDGM